MRNLTRALALATAVFAAVAGSLPAHADPLPVATARSQRALLVVNRGNRPIFEIRIGHDAAQTWSGDLLGFATVIDVSSGREVPLGISPAQCVFDVLATYQGGHREILHDVDLCSTSRVDFTY
jgi:hypothetical protein